MLDRIRKEGEMKRIWSASMVLLFLLFFSLGAQMKTDNTITFIPISHASFVIEAHGTTIIVDPAGERKMYENISHPDLILVTDIHGDHCAPEMIGFLKSEKTTVVGPKVVTDKLGYGTTMNNGSTMNFSKVGVEAIPMYNLTKDRLKFHEKGRGNGYVLTIGGERIYISGDTEDIREIRDLKQIDYAFVCMNLPYTMTVEQAASAVLEFKPKVVLPYHYRGTGGFSDVEEFKRLVAKDPSIGVRLLKWYE